MENIPINAAGLDLIKSFEGLRLTAYLCPSKVPTIGFGHTGKDVTVADVIIKRTITTAEAERLLKADCAKFEKAVADAVKVPLTGNQFAACVSLTYNIGGAAFASSTLCKKLNAKDYKAAADQFTVWNKGGGKKLAGLVRRRAAERALFLK